MSADQGERLAAADAFWRAMGPAAWEQWLAVREQAMARVEHLTD